MIKNLFTLKIYKMDENQWVIEFLGLVKHDLGAFTHFMKY